MTLSRKVNTASIVHIVGDGAIGHPDWGDNRLIPVLILDCTNRDDINTLVLAHDQTLPGDVRVTWVRRAFQNRAVSLIIDFERPARLEMCLEFDVLKQGGLVEGILHSRGVYLQPGKPGDRLINGLDGRQIIVEVPDTGFMPIWHELYKNNLRKWFRKNGSSRRSANESAIEHIQRIRGIWQLRRPSPEMRSD